MMTEFISVVIGGAVGSGLRYLLSAAVPTSPDGFPWATFAVNIAGSFVLGILSGLAVKSDVLSRTSLLLLGTGLCGGFTTFSALSMEGIALMEAGHLWLAASYLGGSLVGGLAAAALGIGAVRITLS